MTLEIPRFDLEYSAKPNPSLGVHATKLETRTIDSLPLTRRQFFMLTSAAAATQLTGCEKYGGVGQHPDNNQPYASAGAFGFTVDWYSDGSFRLNADYRKVILCGMFAAGAIPYSALAAGGVLLSLVDNANNENFVIAVASEGVTSAIGDAVLGPYGDFRFDITQLRSGAASHSFEATRPTGISLTSGSRPKDINSIVGEWRGYAPDGTLFTYTFELGAGNLLLIHSRSLNGPARFLYNNSQRQGITSLTGAVEGILSGDRSNSKRSSKLQFDIYDADTIHVETDYIRFDNLGNELSRRWWPFRLTRV